MSLMLSIYHALSKALQPLVPLLLKYRLRKGKEDPMRVAERMGRTTCLRPPGPLIWLHGASVGEGMTMLPLAQAIQSQGITALLSTGTYGSAQVIATRLPPNTIHQYMPLDFPDYVADFLDYWKPDLILFAESELWPNIMQGAHRRNIPFVLVNACVSQRVQNRWQYYALFIRTMMTKVKQCLAQTEQDATILKAYGASNVEVVGNLKYDVPAPPIDENALHELRRLTQNRLIWLAASTHEGEDELALKTHQLLINRFPNLLTIIMPRHDRRGPAIAELIQHASLPYARRSQREPIAETTQIYLADTMGEVGTFCTLAQAIWMGNSWITPGGGHNPIEPAKLGTVFFHGPNIQNLTDIYEILTQANATCEVRDPNELAEKLADLFQNPHDYQEMAKRALDKVAQLSGATQRTLKILEEIMPQKAR